MAKRDMIPYRSLGYGAVVGDHDAMKTVYQSKVRIVDSILRLSAATIAKTFGVVGKAYIEGIRHAMVLELEGCPVPLSSWREVADRVKGRHSSDYAE